MPQITKILVVLANPEYEQDNRSEIVTKLCKEFMETVQKNGATVDFIDLYKDPEFDPILDPQNKDTKTLEYQIRLRKAEVIVFFHPTWWAMIPAVLKGFLDKVLSQGFAYSQQKSLSTPLLDGKQALVFAIGEKPAWEMRFLYRDILATFWQKIVFQTCGFKGRVYYFGSLRSNSQKKVDNWFKKVSQIGQNLSNSSSILDLL